MYLVTHELWWWCTVRLVLLSCLLALHPSCSPWIKEYFQLSTKTTAAIDSDSADGSRQKKLKTFQKVFTTIDAFKNIHNSWQKVKNKNINRSLEEADSNFH